jgi:hypothetical protein
MFTRSELEIKTLSELKGLCKQYGLKPLGNPGYKSAWIDSLMSFSTIAIRQMKEHEGLKVLSFKSHQELASAFEQMGEPTDCQSALIRATMQGKKLSYPCRYQQETLLNLYKAKMHLETALDLLNM